MIYISIRTKYSTYIDRKLRGQQRPGTAGQAVRVQASWGCRSIGDAPSPLAAALSDRWGEVARAPKNIQLSGVQVTPKRSAYTLEGSNL